MSCKEKIKRGKKGLSPVVATVLLISIVIAIAVIVFFWLRGFTEEAVTKNEENVELICDKVNFRADYSGGLLSVSNLGNVPLYDFKIKVMKGGSFDEYNLREISENEKKVGLAPGKVYSESISDVVGSDSDSVTLIPILLGKSDGNTKTHVCKESAGEKITNI